MYVRCPACRSVALVEGRQGDLNRCRKCGGEMKTMPVSLPPVLRAERRRRVREEDLDISEPAPQLISVEEGLEASHWIREVFGRQMQ